VSESGLVVFDVDGTLLQSHLVTVPAIRETLSEFRITPPGDEVIRATFGVPVEEYEAWLAGLCPPGRSSRIVEATNARELELIAETGALFPGILETLKDLRKHRFALATCTNASVAYLNRVLDGFHLHEYFQENTCIGHGFADKAAMVRHVMGRIPARPAFVVGDRRGDIDAAKANGAYAIAADYGYGSANELTQADAHARAPDEVPNIVVQLTNR
jgi:phosphoglycolate phosphatase